MKLVVWLLIILYATRRGDYLYKYLVQPVGIEPTSKALQASAITISAKVAVWGESGNRTLAYCFTDSSAATTLETPFKFARIYYMDIMGHVMDCKVALV